MFPLSKNSNTFPQAAECVSEQGKARCADIGGTCITERDGYYITTGLCLGLGAITLATFIVPTARKLQGKLSWIDSSRAEKKLTLSSSTALPVAKWRIYR
jgi:hypothetical protein